MQQWRWSKANEKDLAKFVNGDAVKLFDKLGVNRFDLSQTPEGRRELVKAIYNALVARNINYAFEQYQPEAETQIVRPPHEILGVPGEGTCLDLSALFCGLCLGYELLPLLIIIEGHAFAAVSLDHSIDKWDDSFDRQRNLFNQTELFAGDENLTELKQLIDNESYLAIECTGFARTQSFGNSTQPEAKRRKSDGTLSFDNAVSAGREQLGNTMRSFKFAIDIAIAHYGWKIEPLTIKDLDFKKIKFPIVRFAILFFGLIGIAIYLLKPFIFSPELTFAYFCKNRQSDPEQKPLIEILLRNAGSKNCELADKKLATIKQLDLSDLHGKKNSIVKEILVEYKLDRGLPNNIQVLSSLTQLEELDLSGHPQVTDISALRSLKHLKKLDLETAQLTNNLSDLQSLPDLKILNLAKNGITDITALASLQNLTVLNLSNNDIEDVNSLSSLKNLTTLDLRGNKVTTKTCPVPEANKQVCFF